MCSDVLTDAFPLWFLCWGGPSLSVLEILHSAFYLMLCNRIEVFTKAWHHWIANRFSAFCLIMNVVYQSWNVKVTQGWLTQQKIPKTFLLPHYFFFFFLTFNQEKTTLYWGPTFFFSTGLMKFRISVALITIQSSLIFKMHSYHSTLDRWDLHYHSGPNIFLCFSLYWLWNSVTFFRDWEEERKGGYWKYTETCALPWLNTSVKQQPCINKGPSSDKQASQDKKH